MREKEQKVSIHAYEVSKNATGVCKCCFSPLRRLQISDIIEKSILCESCKNELEPKYRHDKAFGTNIYWFYDYNEAFRNSLYLLKGCGDYEMREIFLDQKIPLLRLRFRKYVLVPAPSYLERDQKRGFNHVISIFERIGLPMKDCLLKIEDRKQADLSGEERKKIGEVLKLREGVNLKGKRILFVDDVMTTGSTTKACLKLLKTLRPSRIEVLLLSRVTRT